MRPSRLVPLILTCALASASLAAGAAAGRPKLSGTWELDAGRSSFGGYDGPVSRAKTTLEIRHKEPEVRIVWDFTLGEQRLSKWTVFYSDGRGERYSSLLDADAILGDKMPGSGGGGGPGRQVRSQTAWEGNKLVTRTADRLRVPPAEVSGPVVGGAEVPVEVTDEWELSADGKSLTQTTKVVRADGEEDGARLRAALREFRRVYSRVK